MSILTQNSAKRKLIDDESPETSKKLDKSMHLLRICDEFAGELNHLTLVESGDSTNKFISDDEVDLDEENENRKEEHLESLRNEIVQWKKLLTDSKELSSADGHEMLEDFHKEYEKILTAEQGQYIRSAVDYKKWLAESSEFRKQIAYYLSKRKHSNAVHADFEDDALARIDAVATADFVNNFALHHYPLWHGPWEWNCF